MDPFQPNPSAAPGPTPEQVVKASANTPAMRALTQILMRERAVAYQKLVGQADYGTLRHAQGTLITIDNILRMTTDGL